MSPMVMGKNVARAITNTFGNNPKPNQMIISGAMAMIGSVCETTKSGTSARDNHGEKSTTTARIQANTNETVKPTNVTCNVDQAWPEMISRLSHPWDRTRPGDGSTCGRIPLIST